MSQFEHLSPAYVDLMTALHQQCFDAPWTKDDFLSLLSLPTTKGLINETGMIICSVCGEDAEILTLCVLPQHRKKGIATEMIEQMGRYIKKFQVVSLILEVNVNNTAALKLYEKCGFNKIGMRKDYYKTPAGRQDALVLQKKL